MCPGNCCYSSNNVLLEHCNGVRDICWLDDLNEAIWENFKSRRKHWQSCRSPLAECRTTTLSISLQEKDKEHNTEEKNKKTKKPRNTFCEVLLKLYNMNLILLWVVRIIL